MPLISSRILLLTFILVVGGWLGMKMAVPPGYASPLWPPAGIAFSALLIFGRQLWPGIWLGAWANELLVLNDFNGHLTWVALCAAVMIACASTLQALAAVWLSEKYVHTGVPEFIGPRSIILFFLFSGPLASTIAASVGVSTLLLLGFLSSTLAVSSWWDWWVGDSLGVLIITPLSFCLFGKPRELWKPRCLSVAIPLICMLVGLVLVFSMVFRAEQARVQTAFDTQAHNLKMLLVDYTDNVLDSALALQDLYKVSTKVQRQDFAQFSHSLISRHPEVEVLEWLPRVPNDALKTFETKVQAEGYPNFRINELNSEGRIAPLQTRDEYFPILFIEPMLGNEAAFGLDSFSNSLSRQSKQLARATGKPSVSQRTQLVQSNGLETGVIISIPVYASATSPDRQIAELQGFVSAIIVPSRMISLAFHEIDTSLFGITLTDVSAPVEQSLLYAKPVMAEIGNNYQLNSWQYDFPFVDRAWRIVITPDNSFFIRNRSNLPWITLLGGLIFTSLLSVLLLTISGRAAQVRALVEKKTGELAIANADLAASELVARTSEQKLSNILNNLDAYVYLKDLEGRYLYGNRMLCDLWEMPLADIVGRRDEDFFDAESTSRILANDHRVLMAGETLKVEENNLLFKNGKVGVYLSTKLLLRNEIGEIYALVGISTDITERKQAEESLKLAARVFGEAHEGILITDADAVIINVNPTFCEITGYSREEVIGKNPSILKSDRHNSEFFLAMWETLKTARHWQGEVWNRKKNGDLYAELLTITALCDEEGEILHYVGLFSDITQSKRQIQMLEFLAHYDPLTNLPNRTLFSDRLLQAIARNKRTNSLLAICFLDLDGFKPVNDQFGHEAGDQVLVEAAERIKNNIREEDSVSRHGGDEFALLFVDIHSLEQCEMTMQRIHQAIAMPFLIEGHQVKLSASSGITLYPLDDADPDTLLRHADQAMYKAKLAGKNRTCLFDPSQDKQIVDQQKKIREIEAAFLDKQFCLYYQPKVNIKTGQVVGVEALIRWLHPERGIIFPLDFLPHIASCELEILIGNWVIEEAWRQLVSWHSQGLQIEVSVNISGYHLLSSGFYEHILTVMHNHPTIESKFLQLEILESSALDDLAAVCRIIKTCNDDLGIRIALDDFGTGYSSLNHLRRLSVNLVKIDQSFVRDMLDDPDDFAIVESVISLSQAFRREVLAEGVENKQLGSVLLLLGCHLLQGYSIARPMPAQEIYSWVHAYRPYPEWDFFAVSELSPEQIMLAIRRIDSLQWLQRIHQCLYPESSLSQPTWPILEPANSHLGRWLKRAKHNQQFSKVWLEQVEQIFQKMHALAKILHAQQSEGELTKARGGFLQLQVLQQRLDELFSKLLDDSQ